MKNQRPKVGDLARVRMSNGKPGPTLYHVEAQNGFACTIREVSDDPRVRYAAQAYDITCMVRDADEMARRNKLADDYAAEAAKESEYWDRDIEARNQFDA